MTESIIRQNWRTRPKKFHVDKEWFERVYSVEKMPTWQIAKSIGCVDEHISALADKFGIPRRGRLPRSIPHKRKIVLDDKEIVRLYVEEQMAAGKIGELFGCTYKPVARRLTELGVKMRHHNDTKRGRPSPHRVKIDPDVIASMYAQKYASAQTVADHFGVSRQVIDRIMKENNIATKDIRDARNMSGENHPLWRSDLTPEERENRRDMHQHNMWREKVFARDKYTCQKCGDNKGRNLNAHHIVPHSKDKSIAWELSNGITLCKTCHYDFHNSYGYTKCTADDLAEYLSKETK